MPLEFLGRDWAHVYRAEAARPCLQCRAPTRTLVAFVARAEPLALCGACRGYPG